MRVFSGHYLFGLIVGRARLTGTGCVGPSGGVVEVWVCADSWDSTPTQRRSLSPSVLAGTSDFNPRWTIGMSGMFHMCGQVCAYLPPEWPRGSLPRACRPGKCLWLCIGPPWTGALGAQRSTTGPRSILVSCCRWPYRFWAFD